MVDRQFRLARIWSNHQLRLIAPLFVGDVANISAGTDEDKEGSAYAEYFHRADRYELTNYGGSTYRGFSGKENEFELDLVKPLPQNFMNRYDVVLNHTTLEHIFDVQLAFSNLCKASKDIVIIVVPFAQVQHENEGYKDYWRFTPTCCRALFSANGMTVIYEAMNNDFNAATYLLFVASKHPEKWASTMPSYQRLEEAASWLGKPRMPLLVRRPGSAVKWMLQWTMNKLR